MNVSVDEHLNTKKKTLKRNELYKKLFIFFMLVLPIVHFIIFYVYMNFNSIIMAFQEKYILDFSSGFPIMTGKIKYGFANFMGIFRNQDKLISEALVNTIYYFLVNILIMLPGAFFISYFLFKKIKFSAFFRLVFFLPSIISGVVYVTAFSEIISVGGPINQIFDLLGLKWTNLLMEVSTATPTIIFYTAWTGFGVNILLYQSAMSRVPQEIIESGKLDGVGWGKELFLIITPLMWSTISMTILLALTGIFTGGGCVLLFAGQGGNSNQIATISYWIYAKTSTEGASTTLGYPAATGIFFTIISFPIIMLSRYLLDKFDPDTEY